ncbi:MAG: hypothetical protein ACJAWL_002209 [Motiliproteus sp.]|jgi:hypothetical protein
MSQQFNVNTWKLFQDLVVPAVLGNTAWALASMLVNDCFYLESLPKIISLILITVFFIGDWIGGIETPKIRNNIRFIIASSVFYSTIVGYAIATASITASPTVAPITLICFFLTTVIGHSAGAWKRENILIPWRLVVVSFILAVVLITKILFGWQFLSNELDLWIQPLLLLVYVLVWLFFGGNKVMQTVTITTDNNYN